MRYPILALLLLAGCNQGGETLANLEAEQRAAADDAGRILCARGSEALARRCTLERAATARGLVLTLRHPSGGFRRLLVTGDGRGVVAADGAERAKVSLAGGDMIEVALGGDRYRLPATIKGR